MKLIKPFITISGLTFVSKTLGFIRDVLIASMIGAGLIADVFFVAFKFPNFFRRMFAEGAFNAAFVPTFSSILKQENKRKALEFASQVFSNLFFILLIIILIFEFFMTLVVYIIAPGFAKDPSKYELLIELSRITFPYLLFISLVTLLSGVLNSFNKFAIGAASPILLNLSFILFMLSFEEVFATKGHMLSWAVFFAGILQLIFLFYGIIKNKFYIFFPKPKYTNKIKKFFKLIIPGAIGAGVIQINLLIDVILASFLPTGSISYLYYAERINQLPIALIGVAIGTALLPTLSQQISSNKNKEANYTQNRALGFSILLTLPAAIAIFILANPIISCFFERGEFISQDRILSAKALQAFAVGIPAYVFVKVLIPAFFARQNTVTPVKIASFCVLINFLLNIILMQYYQHVGIAMATAIASWTNAFLLFLVLYKSKQIEIDEKLKKLVSKVTIISIIFGYIVFYFKDLIDISSDYKLFYLIIFVLIGIFLFGILCLFFRAINLLDIKLIKEK